jgi:rhodanese-related sulfurtransferase
MKFLYGLILVFSAYILPVTGQVPDSAKYKSLEPYDFHLQYLMTDSAILLDVREPFEFKGKRIKYAINIPSSGNLEKAADTLNKEFSYFLYCSSGFRSRNTAEKLYEKGFRKLFNLEGGIVAWKKDKMPVVKGKAKRKRSE